MTTRFSSAASALLICGALLTHCTGGQESSAAEEQAPKKNGIAVTTTSSTETAAQSAQVDAKAALKSISPAIPIYAGARYRDDLTRRDSVMIRNQYGPTAEVYTLATDDSFPQVYHYYTTYLAQFRAFPAQSPYPAPQTWRTLEVQLNQAMQDPFIPGDMLKRGDKQVTLQVAETEAEPKTVIRYVVTQKPITAAEVRVPKASGVRNAFDRE
ncbi:MAG: hypothetical protein QOE68_3847 [Thermoanaerobaculia bacterium]|jgi:hypothetical protein|nr:hypothetical protein [Thermoanaerobaculia bacterium]